MRGVEFIVLLSVIAKSATACHFNHLRTDPQPFCLEWAKIVASKEDPFLKRQSVENYKLKASVYI